MQVQQEKGDLDDVFILFDETKGPGEFSQIVELPSCYLQYKI